MGKRRNRDPNFAPWEENISKVYKNIKYPAPKTVKQFQSALRFINERKFTSVTAEKRRIFTVRHTMKFSNNEVVKQIYKEALEKSLKQINDEVKLTDLRTIRYLKDKNETIRFIPNFVENEVYEMQTIIDDVLYTTILKVKNRKLYFSQAVFTPIPMEFYSLNGLLSRFLYRRKIDLLWKNIKTQIVDYIAEKGLTK